MLLELLQLLVAEVLQRHLLCSQLVLFLGRCRPGLCIFILDGRDCCLFWHGELLIDFLEDVLADEPIPVLGRLLHHFLELQHHIIFIEKAHHLLCLGLSLPVLKATLHEPIYVLSRQLEVLRLLGDLLKFCFV